MVAVAEVKVTGMGVNQTVLVCVEMESKKGCEVALRVAARKKVDMHNSSLLDAEIVDIEYSE